MLVRLSIRDFVIIDSLDLQFGSGLSVLTGETGAGKSILLEALSLVLGMRSDVSCIRQGAKESVIIAELSIKKEYAVADLLLKQSISWEENVVIRRVLSQHGRSKAYVNGRQVTVTFLRELGESLLEVQGQFDRFLSVSSHHKLLDAYLGEPNLLKNVCQSYQEWQSVEKIYQKEVTRLEHFKQQEDFLKDHLKDLENLNPQIGEEATLIEQRQQLCQFSKVFEGIHQASHTLQSGETLKELNQAFRTLQKIPEAIEGHIDAATKSLKIAVSETTEAIAQLEDLSIKVKDQPAKLQKIDDRLQKLRAAGRKHNIVVEDLPFFLKQLRHDLETLNQAEEDTLNLERIVKAKRDDFYQIALQLRQVRKQKSQDLDASMARELKFLRLPNAHFQTDVSPREESMWSESGIDKVHFWVAMNKGQELSPLEKTVSGGELTRLILGLKAILAEITTLPTLIFDEIDIGVGGAVAAAIGQRLAKLAKHVQVLAITHSPQVAAASDHHYLVMKCDTGDQMQTTVVKLPLANRYEELARMLSGAYTTDEARAAAQKLLARYGE